MPPIKLLFGLRVTDTTVMTVDYVPDERDDPPPDMTIEKNGSSPWTVSYDTGNARWQATLTAGDHTVRIAYTDEEEWFYNIPHVAFTAVAVMAYHWDNYETEDFTTQWWEVRETTAGGIGGQDPKDPWPPPAGDLSVDNPTWILGRLFALGKTIENPRSGPPRTERDDHSKAT